MAEVVMSNPDDLTSENCNGNKAVNVCNYPRWTINKVANCANRNKENKKNQQSNKKKTKGNTAIPYLIGKSKKISQIFLKNKNKVNVEKLLVRPKDKSNKQEICGPI